MNAFSEEERDQFFIFCTEILTAFQIHQFKMQKKHHNENLAGELLFDEDCFEMIFFEILLRLDFKGSETGGNNFTQQMYLCFERFFIFINEQYGQIVTSTHSLSNLSTHGIGWHSTPLQFDVFNHQLIGIEALWEIILSVQDESISKRASQFLIKLYTKMAKQQKADISMIKELLYQNCMQHIKAGLKDLNEKNQALIQSQQYGVLPSERGVLNDGAVLQLHPDLANSTSIDESKNRIAKSIKLMSSFIHEFEGMGSGRGMNTKASQAEQEVHLQILNQIANCRPSKIVLVCQ